MKSDPTNSPAIFPGIFAWASEIHNYNTRFNLNIHSQSISINHDATTFLLQYQQAIPSESTLIPFLRNISKTSASVSSGVPNTEKQMKARGRRPSAFIVSRCLEPLIKHEARVFEMASQTSVKISWNFFRRIGHQKVWSTGNCSFFIHMVNEWIFNIHSVHEAMCIGEY